MAKKKTDSLVESLKQELGVVEEKPSQKKETAKKTGQSQSSGKHSKKYLEKAQLVDRLKAYKLDAAVQLAQSSSYTAFEGTLEAHINTNQKNMRGLATLPFSAGKKLTILTFGKDAKDSGADMVGDETTIQEILKGKLGFDLVVTTPDWMPKLAPAARVLGPRGLMPSPKNGTITNDLKKTVTELQTGKTEYKTEPNGQVIHLPIGKTTQDKSEISANIKALYNTLGRSRIKKLTLSSTMGPGVKVDLASI